MREILLMRMRERINQFQTHGDPAGILDPAAVDEVGSLLQIPVDPSSDLEVLGAVGLLSWSRYLVLGTDDGERDLALALTVLRPVHEALPGSVPDQVRAYFEQNPLPSSDVDAPAGWSDQAVALLGEASRTGDGATLTAAVELLERAVAATPPDDFLRPMYLSNLCHALHTRFEWTGDEADLDDALRAGLEAVQTTPVDHPDGVTRLSNLSVALHSRFSRTRERWALDALIQTRSHILAVTSADHPQYAFYLYGYGSLLRERFDLAGERADLDEAIQAMRDAVAATPAGHPDRSAYQAALDTALATRSGQPGGQVADSADAVPVMPVVAAVPSTEPAEPAATPAEHLDHAARLSATFATLVNRFTQTGEPTSLDEAVRTAREAVACIPSHEPGRLGALSNLAAALRARFEQTGEQADLDAAVQAARDAAAALSLGHPDRAGILTTFGAVLHSRFVRTGDPRDLDEAVQAARGAVAAATADDPNRGALLSNLCAFLLARFQQREAQSDLDEAVRAGREAAAATPVDHPERAGMLSNLASALRIRFEQAGKQAEPADLDEAISAAREAAVATSPEQPDRAEYLYNLSTFLGIRFLRTRARPDLDASIRAARDASAVRTAPARMRAQAARWWGQIAARGQLWQDAADGYGAATDLLGRVAPRALARSDQEHFLAEFAGLGSDGAACCLRAGMAARALELFEQGRGVLLSQALDTRTDLSDLEARHPDLAAEFLALCDRLDNIEAAEHRMPTIPLLDTSTGGAGEPPVAPSRRDAADTFDRLTARIRQLPGFHDFLRPPPVQGLLATADAGPVVIVIVSEFGSYALILTTDGVQSLPLDALTLDAVEERTVAFLDTLENGASGTASIPDGERELVEVSSWLWDSLASPVLERLGFTSPPGEGQPWPRLWWCTSGLLSLLPVHAAGRPTIDHSSTATVMDRVISSYTPTVRALAHARSSVAGADQNGTSRADAASIGAAATDAGLADAAPAGTRPRVVAVAMPSTPGASDLPGARDEVVALARSLGRDIGVLTGRAATRDAVLTALPTAQWVHFACHGAAYPNNPSANRLLLTDHQRQALRVVDVARLRLPDAELAFLSACETARTGITLADEAVQLASAFQLAGYRHVVATLWPIGDRHAVSFAEGVYQTLAASGDGPVDVAGAVHAATRRMRRRWGWDRPSVWASHIHAGA